MPERCHHSALVLGGGGILGAAWEIGVLAAIEERFGHGTIADRFDLFVGSSAGAFVASIIAQGVPPGDLMTTLRIEGPESLFSFSDVYRVDWRRLLGGGFAASAGMLREVWKAARHGRLPPPLDVFQAGLEGLPAGFLRIDPLAERLKGLYLMRGLHDDFAATQRPILVPALDIDRGRRIVFGLSALADRWGVPEAELEIWNGAPASPSMGSAAQAAAGSMWRDPPLSLAVTASAAIPRLFGAVPIGNGKFVDGDIGGAMHLDVALRTGAQRLLAISPVVASCLPEGDPGCGCRPVSRGGLGPLLDQCSKVEHEIAVTHAVDAARLRWPDADIVLLRPERNAMPVANLMSFGAHRQVLDLAYNGLDHMDDDTLGRIEALLKPCTSLATADSVQVSYRR